MSEVKKKIIINHEHLNPNSQKRGKNGSGSGGGSGSGRKTLKKMPGFVRPSELKNNLIKLLKQKREEKQQQQQRQQEEQNEKQEKKEKEIISGGSSITNENYKPLFDKKKYENIFSKDFEESLNYLKSFKQNNHRDHSTTRKHKHFSNTGNQYNNSNNNNNNRINSVPAMLDVPSDFTSPISLEMPSFIPEPLPLHLNVPPPIKDIATYSATTATRPTRRRRNNAKTDSK
jgi:hypothetical protein